MIDLWQLLIIGLLMVGVGFGLGRTESAFWRNEAGWWERHADKWRDECCWWERQADNWRDELYGLVRALNERKEAKRAGMVDDTDDRYSGCAVGAGAAGQTDRQKRDGRDGV